MTKSEELERGVLSKVADDEPIFVLRARDRLAPHTIRQWVQSAVMAKVPVEKFTEAVMAARAMEEWQEKNGKKDPD